MFDPKGDRSSGWGQSRGPLYHLQKYYPPLDGMNMFKSKNYIW